MRQIKNYMQASRQKSQLKKIIFLLSWIFIMKNFKPTFSSKMLINNISLLDIFISRIAI